jgi:hypothetical protein
MGTDVISHLPGSRVGRRALIALLLTAIATAAMGNLVADVTRLRAAVDVTVGAIGLAMILAGIVGAALLLIFVLMRPERAGIDPIALAVGMTVLVGLRLAAVLLIDAPLIVDWRHYHDLAVTISQGGDWFASRPTGYPMILALGYRIFGPNPVVGEWLNLLLGAVSGLLVYAVALRTAGSRVAGLALVLYAVAPAEILMTPVLGTEIAYGTFLIAALWAILAVPLTLVRAAAGGILLATSQYVRATSLVVAPFLTLAVARLGPHGRRWAVGLVFVGAFMAMLAPVIVANIERSGVPSLSTSSFQGWELLLGTNQRHDGRFNNDDVALVGGAGAPGTPNAERIALDTAIRRIADDPVGIIGLAARKFPTVWGDAHYGARWAIYADAAQDPHTVFTAVLLSQLTWAAIALLAAVGAWRSDASRWRTVGLIGLVIAVFALIHTLVEANPRYHAPLVPLFCVLAGIGAASLIPRRPRLTDPRGRPGPVAGGPPSGRE